jgi:hypothetical protein
MTVQAAAVDADDQAECWCCGRLQPLTQIVELGNHPEVKLCLRCAHFVHRRAREREDQTRPSPMARGRDLLRAGRRTVIHREWHRKPVIGPIVRWLGRHTP